MLVDPTHSTGRFHRSFDSPTGCRLLNYLARLSYMYSSRQHFAALSTPWSDAKAAAFIQRFVDQSIASLLEHGGFEPHPQDDLRDSDMFYHGIPGVLWAIAYLKSVGAVQYELNLVPALKKSLLRNRREFSRSRYSESGTYLMSELPILMLLSRLESGSTWDNAILERAQMGSDQPARELMWGVPGTMLAANFMFRWTGEQRWRDLYSLQAQHLMSEWEEVSPGTHIWSPELYGKSYPYLGAVHGFAGNAASLLAGQEILGTEVFGDITEKIISTLIQTAETHEGLANWRAIHGVETRWSLQHCHGAPGVVTSTAGVPLGRDEGFDALLAMAGELIWRAGPLKKGVSLCHGTAGNGYALLKLHERTDDPLWLERARSFAMTALAQSEDAERFFKHPRFSLWTGDAGLAVYLWDCVRAKPEFPTIDVF